MTLEKALHINSAMLAHEFSAMGLSDKRPQSLSEYSLKELLEARDRVEQENSNPSNKVNGSRTIHVIPSDEMVAALYLLYQLTPDEPAHAMPRYRAPEGENAMRALLVVKVNKPQEKGDAEA